MTSQKIILTNVIWPVKGQTKRCWKKTQNLKLYPPKHKTRMNKKTKTRIYTNELRNNRQSYAEKN